MFGQSHVDRANSIDEQHLQDTLQQRLALVCVLLLVLLSADAV